MARPPGEGAARPACRLAHSAACSAPAATLIVEAAPDCHKFWELPPRRQLDGGRSGGWHPAPSARLPWAQVEVMVSLGVGQAPPARREKGLSSFMETGSILIESRWVAQRGCAGPAVIRKEA